VAKKKTKRKDAAAAALGRKRWAKKTAEEKSEHARRMSEARWRKTPRKEDR
jgi:hypothetical protein